MAGRAAAVQRRGVAGSCCLGCLSVGPGRPGCLRQEVVLLGEDATHGSGKTLEIKVELVHQALGARAAAIGFSALTGSYGRPNRPPTILASAPPGALEQRALQDPTEDIAYINAAELKKRGEIAARTINYPRFITARWDQVLDGIIVLRQERPPEYVRSAKPQQATQ